VGQFRRRIFGLPALGEKTWPSTVSISNISASGWASPGGPLGGFTLPMVANQWVIDNGLLIPKDAGAPCLLGENFPLWDVSYAQSVQDRVEFTSMVWEFRALGFDQTVLEGVNNCCQPLELNAGGWAAQVAIGWHIPTLQWVFYLLHDAAGAAPLIPLPNFIDVICNVMKVNITRINANEKRLDAWVYDSSLPGWRTTTITSFVAGVGDDVLHATFGWAGIDKTALLPGKKSFVGLKSMRASSADIPLSDYVLPQMP